jgi:hypothetical protein
MAEETVYTPQRRQRGARGISGAIILIGLGAAFLLNNLGIITLNWWNLLRYWPVFLILIGIDLILGRSAVGSVIAAALGLCIVGAVIFVAGNTADTPAFFRGEMRTETIEQEILEAESLDITMKLAVASAEVTTMGSDDFAVQGTYRTNTDLSIETRYSVSDGTGYLDIRQQEGMPVVAGQSINELDISFPSGIPARLNIDMGVGELNLDLSEMDLTGLTLSGGVGVTEVRLPNGDYEVNVDAGVGQVIIHLPEGAEGRLVYNGGLVSFEAPAGFVKLDDHAWETAGYTPDNGLTITIEAGVGNIEVTY